MTSSSTFHRIDQKFSDKFFNINGRPKITKYLRKVYKVKEQNKQKQINKKKAMKKILTTHKIFREMSLCL